MSAAGSLEPWAEAVMRYKPHPRYRTPALLFCGAESEGDEALVLGAGGWDCRAQDLGEGARGTEWGGLADLYRLSGPEAGWDPEMGPGT